MDGQNGCNRETCRRLGSAATDPSKFAVPSNIANSTQILFVEPNFTETPSEYEVFYDCLSDHDVRKDGAMPKADYVPKSSYTPINEMNTDKSSMICGLCNMPSKSDVLTVNIGAAPTDTKCLPQEPNSPKCKKCNLPKSNLTSADYLSRVAAEKCPSGGRCKKCNKPKVEMPDMDKSNRTLKCDVPKPDNVSNMDFMCKADPESSKASAKCKKCNMNATGSGSNVNFATKTEMPETKPPCGKCKVCNLPNICGPPKATESKTCGMRPAGSPKPEFDFKANNVSQVGDAAGSCALPRANDVPKEGTVLPMKCMPNIVGCLSDCKDFRTALQHVITTATKLLSDFEMACRREKRCQKRKSQARTVQLELTAKMAPSCSNQTSGVVIEPFSFTIPLRLRMQPTPPTSKMSLDVGASVSTIQSSCCKTSLEPIRTATISAMNRTCQIKTSEQDAVPTVQQASCCTMTMVSSGQMICMKQTVKEAFKSEEPFEEVFEDFQSLVPPVVPDCVCLKTELPAPVEPPKELEPPKLIYYKALPQHRCLDTCTPCRYSPSPLIDEEGRVFCPYNCGCCLCPWKRRATESLEERLKHQKIKVCKCRERGTIFTEFEKLDPKCSVVSYFDVCPCREKAEAKFLELYGTEMWTVDERLQENVRGDEVKLEEVKEIIPPNEPRRWPAPTHG